MGYIYLAAPYSHIFGNVSEQSQVKHARFKVIEFMTFFYMKQKQTILSPIVHNHQLARNYALPGNFNYWKAWNEAFLAEADAVRVLQLPNWQNSAGVRGETLLAEQIGMIVEYVSWDEIKLAINSFTTGNGIKPFAFDLEHTHQYS